MSDLGPLRTRIFAAATPEALFGPLTGTDPGAQRAAGLKVFHQLAKATHPDLFPVIEREIAQEMFQRVTDFWAEAEARIAAGLYGTAAATSKPVVITTKSWSFEIGAPLAGGEIANLFRVTATPVGAPACPAILKIARRATDNDLIRNEATVLKRLARIESDADHHFQGYLPELIAHLKIDDGSGPARATNAFRPADTYLSLEEICTHYPEGLDLRHVGWMWNRVLEALTFVHGKGIVHGAITPAHLLYNPISHGLILVGWSAAVADFVDGTDHIRIVSRTYRDFYAPEVFDKAPAGPATDLYMAARAMLFALAPERRDGAIPTDLPRALAGFLRASLLKLPSRRIQDALAARRDLGDILETIYGPPAYRPLAVPQS